ncbi:class I SAM-dependent rRNA methyltransferase [Singulisphaera sp. PoT]|uniref:class I SAM-dependent rRNA methyltransferase n=1 Tax=Singulisphaera sp. PoT TaxID=3411797 RepID=UPI003BF4F462
MAALPRVVIKPRRARPFFARHPWVFVTSIGRVDGEPEAGGEVEVVSHEGQFIGRGIYNPKSAIRVRLYRWDGGELDDACWTSLVASAVRLRHDVLGMGNEGTAYRLIASEADGLSGLTVDRYDRWLVAQFTSLALFQRREALVAELAKIPGLEGILFRPERVTAEQEGIPPQGDVLWGTAPAKPVEIVENGLTYWVDLMGGQKTGFYLDQRDNRRAVASYCKGKTVLDLCCYTGGFSLNALKHGGAASTLGIDTSSTAVEVARHHAAINELSGATFETGEFFPKLEALRSEGRRFGVVICDPPKFARNPKGVEDALKGYLRLNRAALDVLEPDGILVTCSCSGLVDRALFADIIGQVAEQSGRPIQILEQRGQAPDHPILASCLETEYLKCFICRVI